MFKNKLFFIFALSTICYLSSSFNSNKKLLHPNVKSKTFYIEEKLRLNHNENTRKKIVNFEYKNYKIDSIFRKLSSKNMFNGCVLVAQHGQIIYKNSFGSANPVLNEPLQDNSVFQLASVSKTITAVATLLLIEQNMIGLDDYFSIYFPSFPYQDVTIRQLLSHRSGIPNYIYLDKKHYPQSVMYYTNQDAFNALCQARAPKEFATNARFKYNNSNYALLGLLIEKISGKSFQDFVKENVFDPLGMKNSYFAYPDQIWSMENRTFGLYNNNQIYPNDKFDGVFGDKGAYSTINDMFLFDRALYPDVLLQKNTLDLAFSNHVLEHNATRQYGLGFRLREDQNKQKIIYHNGWWHGYRTAFHRRESDNSCVIILSNRLNTIVYHKAKEMFKILDNFQETDAEDEAEHSDE